ncbi:MAG: hypothetical protein E4H01_16450 [Lysobacterales bacterium]|nr:MAG: hypothetical protein E4H01_16450 [Xanthomonadales bacterium]
MSTFDPASFLDQTTTEGNSTVSVPVPEGDYTAVIDGDPEVRQWQGKKDPSKSGLALDIQWSIDSPGVRELLGRDLVRVKQGIMLDLNESGGLDTGRGRNVPLGRLREAVGLNTPGKPFNFRMLTGKVATVKIVHRTDGDAIYAEVKAVAPLA